MEQRRGILYGLPVILLDDGGCTPTGPVSGVLLDFMCSTFGFNGAVLEYEDGDGYWKTLWHWLTVDFDEDEDGGGT